MVKGLDIFRDRFENYTDSYVLIGGTACSIAHDIFGIDFRKTQDLDIVLCIDKINDGFSEQLWNLIRDGQYINQTTKGKKTYYRFTETKIENYPDQIELFSIKPDVISLPPEAHLTPIPTDENIRSLSAILLDDTYYHFIIEGKQVNNRLAILKPEYLLPLKTKAWLDLTEFKKQGIPIHTSDIEKHRKDVFRLMRIIPQDIDLTIPKVIQNDILQFIESTGNYQTNLRDLGFNNMTIAEIYSTIISAYRLKT